jgi:hypothetical protein
MAQQFSDAVGDLATLPAVHQRMALYSAAIWLAVLGAEPGVSPSAPSVPSADGVAAPVSELRTAALSLLQQPLPLQSGVVACAVAPRVAPQLFPAVQRDANTRLTRALASSSLAPTEQAARYSKAHAMDPVAMVKASPFYMDPAKGHTRLDHHEQRKWLQALHTSPSAVPAPAPVSVSPTFPPPAWVDELAKRRAAKGKPPPSVGMAPYFKPAALHDMLTRYLPRVGDAAALAERELAIQHLTAMSWGAPLPFYLHAYGDKRWNANVSQYSLEPADRATATALLAELCMDGRAVPFDGEAVANVSPFIVHKGTLAPPAARLNELYAGTSSAGLASHFQEVGDSVIAAALSRSAASEPSSAAPSSAAPGPRAIKASSLSSALDAIRTESKPRLVLDFKPQVNPRLADWHFSYLSLQDLLSHAKPGHWIASLDISSAFHLVRMHPDAWKFMTVLWPPSGDFSEDRSKWVRVALTRLSFGLKHAPALFSALSGALVSVMQARSAAYAEPGSIYFGVFVDDVFVIGPTELITNRALEDGNAVLFEVGADVNGDKLEYAVCREARVLGPVLDLVDMILSLPLDKRYTTSVLLAVALAAVRTRHALPLNFVEKLAGKLTYAQLVVPAGRLHCVSVYQAIRAAYAADVDLVNLEAAEADLSWWLSAFCDPQASFRRLNLYPVLASANNTVTIRSDASGDIGAGLVIGAGDFVVAAMWECWGEHALPSPAAAAAAGAGAGAGPGPVALDHVEPTIQAKELHPLLWALKTFGRLWSGLFVNYLTDNLANMYAINKGVTADATAFGILADIIETAIEHDVHIVAHWLPRDANTLCDALSKSSSASEALASLPEFPPVARC